MMEGLRKDSCLEVLHGVRGKVLAALRTWIKHRPVYIHYDWNYSYFLRRYLFLTWINSALFLLELLILKCILRCRVVWTMHNIHSHEAPHPRTERLVQQAFARLCDWIRVFSASSVRRASLYLNVSPDKFRIVPEGSYVGYYPNIVTTQEARERLGIDQSAFVLLYFGSIRQYKGVAELVDAFKLVPYPNWRLVIAGPPRVQEHVNEIKWKTKSDPRIVLFMDLVPEDEVQYFFNACDVVVLPFREVENSGSVILAMGFAKPVVAPALGVLPERLRQQLALLYPPGHLYEALERLQRMDREALNEIGRRNLEEVERYRWEDFAGLFA